MSRSQIISPCPGINLARGTAVRDWAFVSDAGYEARL
jgi:hypothetical protein